MKGEGALSALMAMRADASPITGRHPEHSFRPLPQRLGTWQSEEVNVTIFHAGVETARARYASYGLTQLLPPERVLVGCESSRAAAFGGFHHADQGYRHLQMVAVITMHGPMERATPERPALALLDLLRAYAHDCLHYGSRRRYMEVGGKPVRTQYGINWRRTNGQSYSAADMNGAPYTRNIGVVMEGACDREARSITRLTAERFGIGEPSDSLGMLAFRDVTGTLTRQDTERAPALDWTEEEKQYAAALKGYEAGINRRYASFLAEFAPGEENECHGLILGAMISGTVEVLGPWLDDRHGPGSFPGLFLTPGYFGSLRASDA